MEQLNDDIQDFIDSISITSNKEALYIKKNNWVDIVDFKAREEEFDLQNLLCERNLLHATNLYKLSKADLKHPAVKAMLDSLIATFHVHGARISKYIIESDWSEQLTDGSSRASMKAEIEFQSELNKHLAKFKAIVRTLNYSEESQSVDIQIFGGTKIPLCMASQISERYPEIVEMLNKKREKFYAENPPKVEVVKPKAKKVKK